MIRLHSRRCGFGLLSLNLTAQCGEDSKCRFFCFLGENSNSCALKWVMPFSLLPSVKAPVNNLVSAFENQGLGFSTEITQLLTALPQSSTEEWVAVVWGLGLSCFWSQRGGFRGSQHWPMYFCPVSVRVNGSLQQCSRWGRGQEGELLRCSHLCPPLHSCLAVRGYRAPSAPSLNGSNWNY